MSAYYNPLDPTYRDDPYPHLARLRREDLEHWTHALMRSTDPTPMTIGELAECNTAAYSFRGYFLDLAARRQQDPSQDIFRDMVRARDEGKITEEEMISNFILLFCAGHDT